MVARCHDRRNFKFPSYGARGISVCARWRGEDGFLRFLEDMGVPPNMYHSLDRIDTNGNYTKRNCRWATLEEQNRNRRSTHFITDRHPYSGEIVELTITEWERLLGLSSGVVSKRLQRGWTEYQALVPF